MSQADESKVEPVERPCRFLKMDQVAAELSISEAQMYALVRSGDLAAIKVGGRGQWRIERVQLEAFIDRMYEETAKFVRDHPFGGNADDEGGSA